MLAYDRAIQWVALISAVPCGKFVLLFTYFLEKGFYLDLFTRVLTPHTTKHVGNFPTSKYTHSKYIFGDWGNYLSLVSKTLQGLCRGYFLSRDAVYIPPCFFYSYLYFKPLQKILPEQVNSHIICPQITCNSPFQYVAGLIL